MVNSGQSHRSEVAGTLAILVGVLSLLFALSHVTAANASIDRIAGTDYQLGNTATPGEVVASALGGTVQTVSSQTSAGNYIVIDHGNTHMTRYLHLQAFVASNGAYVGRGEIVASEGNTGGPWCQDPPACTIWASPYHLHFETKVNAIIGNYGSGTAVDPYGASTFLWEDSPANHADFSPAVATYTYGRTDVFARGRNNDLYQKTWTGGWTGWNRPIPSQPQCLRSAPTATAWGGKINVFFRGCDNDIWRMTWDNGAWSSATRPIIGLCTLNAPAATSWSTSRIDVFYRGCNNILYEMTWNGTNWSQTVPISGTCLLSGPGAVAPGVGRFDLAYRGCDNAVYHHWYNGSPWYGQSFGGCTMVAPAVASWDPSRVDVFARGCGPAGTAEGIFQKSYNGSSWGPWLNLGGCLASGPGSDAWSPDRLDVLYRDCNYPAGNHEAYWNGGGWTHLYMGVWP